MVARKRPQNSRSDGEEQWRRLPRLAAELRSLKVDLMLCTVTRLRPPEMRRRQIPRLIWIGDRSDRMVAASVTRAEITGLSFLGPEIELNGWSAQASQVPRSRAWRSSPTARSRLAAYGLQDQEVMALNFGSRAGAFDLAKTLEQGKLPSSGHVGPEASCWIRCRSQGLPIKNVRSEASSPLSAPQWGRWLISYL